MLMMAIARKVVFLDRETRRGNFHIRDKVVGRELFNAKLGVVGFGHIGQRLAEICWTAFEMEVFVYDPYLTKEQIAAKGGQKCESLNDLMAKADFVSLHIPLIESTKVWLMPKH